MLEKEGNKGNKLNLLSPKVLNTNDDGINNYFKNLKELIENEEDVKNIAITGGYGTGKSSIIKTYIKEYSNNSNNVIISISSFLKTRDESIRFQQENSSSVSKTNDSDGNTIDTNYINNDSNNYLEPSEKELVEILEKTIVRQLIYRLGYSDSKLSGVSKPLNNWKGKYILYSIVLTFLLIYYLFMFKPDLFLENLPYISKLKDCTFLFNKYKICIFSFVIFSSILVIFDLIYNILIAINHKKMKLKVVNNKLDEEFEMDKSDDTNNSKFSFLDYIYEIIYFFQNSRVKTVFFEDIDRYGSDVCMKVTEDLKELNLILNSCSGIDKKITFVYSLRDSIYSKITDRTKFYDFIISVLPLSTSVNAILNYSNEFEFYEIDYRIFSTELMNIATYYIRDVRTIKSVVNDYYLFNKIIKNEQHDKLFAMMLFKNYYLKEYDDLIIENNNYIEIRLKAIKKEIYKDIEDSINKYREEINKIKESSKYAKIELKKLFLYDNAYNANLPTIIRIFTENRYKDIKTDEFMRDDFNMDLINERTRFDCNGYTNRISSSIDEIKILKEKIKANDKKLDDMENEYKEKEKLLYDENYFKIKKKEKYKEKKTKRELLDDLIYNEYIDNNYMNYITSMINDKSLSGNDSRFLNNIRLKNIDYNLKIDNIDKIIRHLPNEEYNGVYILNDSLINNLVKSQKYKGILEKISEQFLNISREHLDFLCHLKINNCKLYYDFLALLEQNSEEIWNNYISKYNDDRIYNMDVEIIIEIMLRSRLIVEKIKKKEILKSMIERFFNNKYYDILDNENIVENLKIISVHFDDIKKILPERNDKLIDKYELVLKKIIENNIYKININNLKVITNSKKLTYDDIKKSNYYSEIKKYIKENLLDAYMELYVKSDQLIESNEIIGYLLEELPHDIIYYKYIIERENIDFNDYIELFDEESIIFAYDSSKILVGWKTIEKLLNKYNSLNELIYKMIIENKNKLIKDTKGQCVKKIPVGMLRDLINYFASNNGNDMAKFLISKCNKFMIESYYTIKKNDSEEKILLYLNNKMLDYNKKNATFISENFKKECINLYISNGLSKKGKRFLQYFTKEVIEEYNKYINNQNE